MRASATVLSASPTAIISCSRARSAAWPSPALPADHAPPSAFQIRRVSAALPAGGAPALPRVPSAARNSCVASNRLGPLQAPQPHGRSAGVVRVVGVQVRLAEEVPDHRLSAAALLQYRMRQRIPRRGGDLRPAGRGYRSAMRGRPSAARRGGLARGQQAECTAPAVNAGASVELPRSVGQLVPGRSHDGSCRVIRPCRPRVGRAVHCPVLAARRALVGRYPASQLQRKHRVELGKARPVAAASPGRFASVPQRRRREVAAGRQ